MNNPGYLGSSLRQILLKLELYNRGEEKKKYQEGVNLADGYGKLHGFVTIQDDKNTFFHSIHFYVPWSVYIYRLLLHRRHKLVGIVQIPSQSFHY